MSETAPMTGEALVSKVRRREEMLDEYDRQIERLRADIDRTTRNAEAEKSKAIAAEAANRSLREEVEAARQEAKEAAEEAERARIAARARKEAEAKPALVAMSVPVDERSMNDDKALLAWVETVPFFQANARNDRMRRHICNSLECVTYQPLEPIVTQGEIGDAFYVILSGTVQVLVNGNLVGEMESGQGFGERALSESTDRRSATVVAHTLASCAVLEKQAYIESIDASRAVADQASMSSPQAGANGSSDDDWTETDESSTDEEDGQLDGALALDMSDSEEDEEEEEHQDEKILELLKEEMGMEPESTLEETLDDAREYMGTEVQEEDIRAEMYMVAFDLGIIDDPEPPKLKTASPKQAQHKTKEVKTEKTRKKKRRRRTEEEKIARARLSSPASRTVAQKPPPPPSTPPGAAVPPPPKPGARGVPTLPPPPPPGLGTTPAAVAPTPALSAENSNSSQQSPLTQGARGVPPPPPPGRGVPKPPSLGPPAPPVRGPPAPPARGPPAPPGRGSPGPPPGGPVVKLNIPKPKVKLRGVNWAKLAGRLVSGTVWEKLAWQDLYKDGVSKQIDLKQLESQFVLEDRSKASLRVKPDGSPKKATKKAAKVALLDPKIGNNCAIVLSRFRIPNEQLALAIWEMDQDVFDEEAVEAMVPFVPTADEKVLLTEHKGPVESLGAAEQYYLSIMHIPRLGPRLRCWDIAFKFEARVDFVQSQLEAGILACRAIKTSKAFKRFLDLVLTVGNLLNAGGFRGSAAAVGINVLTTLKDTKSNTSGETLLHYLVELIKKQKREDELFQLLDDFEFVEEAAKIDFQYLKSEVARIQTDVARVRRELETVHGLTTEEIATARSAMGGKSDMFPASMDEFWASSEGLAMDVAATYEMLEAKIEDSVTLVGEDPKNMSGGHLLQLLNTFREDLIKVRKEDRAARREAARRKSSGESAKQAAKIARQKRAGSRLVGEQHAVLEVDRDVTRKMMDIDFDAVDDEME